MNLSEEQALYARPELRYNAMVFTSFASLSNTKQLNLNLRVLDDWIVRKGVGFLCELLNPLVVVTSIEKDILLLLDLFDKT